MSKKKTYRIRNWHDYNKALVNRGSLTVWFDSKSIAGWHSQPPNGSRGRPQIYSDLAIECCLTLKMVFKMPLRATQGFVSSLIELLGLPLSVPNYSLLCLRQKKLSLRFSSQTKLNQPMHLVIDSTGLKLYGEGEWKVRKHGKEKRRSWLKLHLAVDDVSQSIQASLLTADDVHDCEVLPGLLDQIEQPIDQVTGDGAYDTHDAYASVIEKGASPCFPPRKNATRHNPTDEAYRLRNHAVSQVHYHSLKYWKKKHRYHRRSLAETAMWRFKQLLGDRVQARTMAAQSREIGIKCLVMNKMNQLGMPVVLRA